MPKASEVSTTRVAASAPVDESSVLESIRLKPELSLVLDHLNTSGGRKKQQALWEKCAKEVGCSVEILKKAWLTGSKNGEAKKAKEPSETRPRSARSSSIEPKERRRSLRSQSIDKMSTTSTTVLESTDNSCASSVCGSPRSEDRRQQQQQQQQRGSRRNLCAITEDDINLEATAAASTADSSQQREKARIDDSAGPSRETVTATDNHQAASNDADEAHEPSTSALTRYLETALVNEAKPARTARFSEPVVQTPRNSQAALAGLSSASRRLPSSSNGKGPKIRMPNPEDSTRMFFESIGLTVMSFPQHLQASVKSQVSTIVHEMEFELCSPLTETSVTTVSVGS